MDSKLLMILVLNVVLFILVRVSKKKKHWHNLFVAIFSIFFTLTIIECVYRFFIKKNSFVMRGQALGAYASNNVTGYTLARAGSVNLAKLTLKGDTIYNTVYTIQPDSGANNLHLNHRAAFRSMVADTLSVNEIIFLGCSITYGEGIRDNETFAYRAGENCNVSSVNLGFSGYGTHQAYQIYMNKYAKHPDTRRRVFVYNFIPDHILRAKCVYPWNNADPYFEVINDSLVLKGKAYRHSGYALTHKIFRYLSLLYSFTFLSDLESTIVIDKASKNLSEQDYQRVGLMLQKMRDTMRANGDRLLVVYWDKFKWTDRDDGKVLSQNKIGEMMQSIKGQVADVIKVSEVFNVTDSSYFIRGDGHPTAAANALLASAISARICNH